MQREEFGRVCASLRQDIIHSKTCKPWSQADLAKACNLSQKMVGQIERGERVNLDNKTLLQLANCFHLSTVERRRFFSLASNVDREQLPRDDQSFEQVIKRVLTKMEAVHQPALLHDGLYRIVALNSAYMQVYGLTELYLDSIPAGDPTKFHIVRHIHDPESPVRANYMRHLSATEMNNVNYWRYLGLTQRHSVEYEQIQNKLLSSFRNFKRLWGVVSQQHEEQDRINLLRAFGQSHPILGDLNYTVVSNQIFDGKQELYLTLLVPTDRPTFRVFHDLVDEVGFKLRIFQESKPMS